MIFLFFISFHLFIYFLLLFLYEKRIRSESNEKANCSFLNGCTQKNASGLRRPLTCLHLMTARQASRATQLVHDVLF